MQGLTLRFSFDEEGRLLISGSSLYLVDKDLSVHGKQLPYFTDNLVSANSDVIIGAYQYDDGVNTNEGKVFVYYGSMAGLSLIPDSTPDDADQAGASFGVSVASAGDINGDGYSDVIIAADEYDDGTNTDEGWVFIYLGSAAGLLATPSYMPGDADQPDAYFG